MNRRMFWRIVLSCLLTQLVLKLNRLRAGVESHPVAQGS